MDVSFIIKIQRRFRCCKFLINNFNKELDKISSIFDSLMYRINNNYTDGIITQYKFNKYITILENCMEKYINIPYPITLKYYNRYKCINIRNTLDEIEEKILIVLKNNGCKTINDIFSFIYNIDIDNNKLNNKYFELLDLLNNTVCPISLKIFYINKSGVIDENLNYSFNESFNENNLQSQNIIDNDTSLIYNEFISNKLPICKKLIKTPSTLLEQIYGGKIFIPIYTNDDKLYSIIILNGVFKKDLIGIYKNHLLLKDKIDNIKNQLQNLNIIDTSFKNNYINQLSICDLLIYNNDEIINKITEGYKKLELLKKEAITGLIKKFTNANLKEQIEILILFLLIDDTDNDKNSNDYYDLGYISQLLYDIICQDDYLLKSPKNPNQIYNNLPRFIQNKLKVNIKKNNENELNKKEFSLEDLPYEKRINLMKAEPSIKAKAINKYKEIMNKSSGESNTKSKQYLDGLLKIPFGIYKKEKILCLLDDYKFRFGRLYIQIKEASEFYDNTEIKQKLDILIEKFNNINFKNINSIKYYTIDIIIKQIYNLTNENENIEFFLKNYWKNNKYTIIKKHVKNIIEDIKLCSSINSSLEFIDNINLKSTKKILLEQILDLFNNYLDKYQINKYIYYLKNGKIDINNLNFDKYNLILDKINKFYIKWNNYKKVSKSYINSVSDILDNSIFSQNDAKKEIERIIAQWINGEMKGYCFGFEGPPGTGKTTLAKKGISYCLKDDNGDTRPFSFIAIGGSSNGSVLEGHSYTYVGSTWGKIVDILMDTKCMNPIIYIDELDKISNTENGKELISILTHITDSSQNNHFNDKYFTGINIDLSKVLFIFSYNDYNLLDPILADRIHRVKFNHLSNKEKIVIIQNYIFPEILNTVGFSNENIIIDDKCIEYIIDNYTNEAGVRRLKEYMFEIVREINLRSINNNDNIVYPIKITCNIINDIFCNKAKIQYKKINNVPKIGLVNGLYATTSGKGGLTIIECFKTYSESKLNLILTGQQGNVMKESMECAKTIAWNVIPSKIKKEITKDFKTNGSYGIHIHCPEASTPKDGPSAGLAITLAIISLLTKIPIKNTIALTGEIDLNGNAHQIGGLNMKIDGGKFAGAETILYPTDNIQDIDIINNKTPEILENIELIPVKNIWDVLKYCLVKNNLNFERF